MKEILGKSIFEIDFSGLKASVIFWLVATYQVDIKEYDTMVESQNCFTIYINDLTSFITHSQPLHMLMTVNCTLNFLYQTHKP